MNEFPIALLDLALAQARQHPLCRADVPEAAFREFLDFAWQRAINSGGLVHLVPNEEGVVQAAALAWHESNSFTGSPCWQARLLTRNCNSPASELAARALGLFAQGVDGPFDVVFRYNDTRAADVLETFGLHVHSVTLLGSTHQALDVLENRRVPEDFTNWGLHCDLLASASEVPEIVKLYEESFETRYGWFLADGAYRSLLAEQLRTSLEKVPSPDVHLILRAGEGVVGCLSVNFQSTPAWGMRAGLCIVLAREWQRRGLARAIYRRLLNICLERGARVFFGGTAQPAVMKIASEIGRIPTDWIANRTKYFPRQHFQGTLVNWSACSHGKHST